MRSQWVPCRWAPARSFPRTAYTPMAPTWADPSTWTPIRPTGVHTRPTWIRIRSMWGRGRCSSRRLRATFGPRRYTCARRRRPDGRGQAMRRVTARVRTGIRHRLPVPGCRGIRGRKRIVSVPGAVPMRRRRGVRQLPIVPADVRQALIVPADVRHLRRAVSGPKGDAVPSQGHRPSVPGQEIRGAGPRSRRIVVRVPVRTGSAASGSSPRCGRTVRCAASAGPGTRSLSGAAARTAGAAAGGPSPTHADGTRPTAGAAAPR